jgi:hypothetical protein
MEKNKVSTNHALCHSTLPLMWRVPKSIQVVSKLFLNTLVAAGVRCTVHYLVDWLNDDVLHPSGYMCLWITSNLTPKGPRSFFSPFLKFGQAIVDGIFVQKISNFWWICDLVLASRHTNFYEILISNLGAMPQKQDYFAVRAARAAKKLFILKLF